jgi:hypothetical protein
LPVNLLHARRFLMRRPTPLPSATPLLKCGAQLAFAWILCAVVSGPSAADVVLLSQDRSVVASGLAEGPLSSDSDAASDAAPGFDFFLTGDDVDVEVEGATAVASAGQQSGIGPWATTLVGTVGVNGGSSHPNGVGIANASSYFEFTFEVETPQTYHLLGLLVAHGVVATFLELTGPEGAIERFDSPSNGNQSIGGEGILLPGEYTLVVESSGSAVGAAGSTDSGDGLYELSITLEDADPAAVPFRELDSAPALRFSPNPTSSVAQLELASPTRTGTWISIHDVSGRVLRSWPTAPGTTSVEWNTRDGNGALVPAGIYFARLGGVGQGSPQAKVIVAR